MLILSASAPVLEASSPSLQAIFFPPTPSLVDEDANVGDSNQRCDKLKSVLLFLSTSLLSQG